MWISWFVIYVTTEKALTLVVALFNVNLARSRTILPNLQVYWPREVIVSNEWTGTLQFYGHI